MISTEFNIHLPSTTTHHNQQKKHTEVNSPLISIFTNLRIIIIFSILIYIPVVTLFTT